MKMFFRDKKLILYIAIGILFLFGGNRFASYILYIDGFSCDIDKKISELHACKILQYMHTNKALREMSLFAIANDIKNTFSIIKDIILVKSARGILQIYISAVSPKFVINNEYVLSYENFVFHHSLFTPESISHCPCIRLGLYNEKISISESCKYMINNLLSDCFDRYDIVWENETKSWLLDKQNKNFAIVCNDVNVPDKKMMAACFQLKCELESKGYFSHSFIGRWVADVRFKDQIVLYKDIGGGDG